MYDAVYNVARFVVCGRAAGLDRARLVVGNIHDHRAFFHEGKHVSGDEELFVLLPPFDTVENDIRFRQFLRDMRP